MFRIGIDVAIRGALAAMLILPAFAAAARSPAPARAPRPAPAAAPAATQATPAAPPPAAEPEPEPENAPEFATAGYVKPRMVEPGCVQRSVRLSPALRATVTGTVTAKFAVSREGVPGRFEVTGGSSDPRVAEALWSAVRTCRWLPGNDAQGRPTAIWIVLPFRFTNR